MSRRAGSCLVRLLACLPAAAGLASAQSQVTLPESKVVARAFTAWPASLSKGYFPIRVELENQDARPHRVELVADTDVARRGNEVARSVELAPGEELRLDLVVPAFGSNEGLVTYFGGTETYTVRVACRGEEARLSNVHGFSDLSSVHPVLVLAPESPAAGSAERWAAEIGTEEILVGSRKIPNVAVGVARFADAPAGYAAYTSLDAVVVDVAEGPPPAAVLDAVLRWGRVGGVVCLFGRRAERVALETPGLAGWLEERFHLSDAGGIDVYALGFGLLLVDERPALRSPAHAGILGRLLTERFAPIVPHQNSQASWVPDIPGLAALPYRALTLALVLFALLIGPVNFLVLKNGGRPGLLLVTIPALALTATVAILGYGLLHQGFDVKLASFSMAVLDQREHRAAGLELRSFYSGISPGGLRPAQETTCHPHARGDHQARSAGFRIEADGPVLSGDYAPVRLVARQTLQSERAARGRLEVGAAGSATLEAVNGLGSDVRFLLLRDFHGTWHHAPEGIPDGERAELLHDVELWLADYDLAAIEEGSRGGVEATPEAPPDPGENAFTRLYELLGPHGDGKLFYGGAELDERARRRLAGVFLEHLPLGTYVALLAENPLADDFGIGSRELAGRHWVLGVLDGGEAR